MPCPACPAYTDLRLAVVYDPLNPMGPDNDFHAEIAGGRPLRILDMGCGTGRFAVELARRGHTVTGADPAHGMLEIARNRDGGGLVRWIEVDAAGLDTADRFDLIVMTGHVFQVFLADEEIVAALANLRLHLASDGRISFETRNPLVREWQEWLPDLTQETVEVEGVGPVDVHYDIASVDGELVTYETHFRFPDGAVSVATSTLRFMPYATLTRLLGEADLRTAERYGDWDRSPLTESSPEIIVVAGPA